MNEYFIISCLALSGLMGLTLILFPGLCLRALVGWYRLWGLDPTAKVVRPNRTRQGLRVAGIVLLAISSYSLYRVLPLLDSSGF